MLMFYKLGNNILNFNVDIYMYKYNMQIHT